MVLRIRLNSGKYLKLVSVYASTMQRTQEEKEHFYQSFTDTLYVPTETIFTLSSVILAQEWAKSGPNVLGKQGIGKMNASGLMLLDFCTKKLCHGIRFPTSK